MSLTEHFDYTAMAKQVANSASRAFGLLVAQFKALGGMQFNANAKSYEFNVWSTISYGAAAWCDRQFSSSNAVQNKAARFFMGVGRYTPNTAVNGDTDWMNPFDRQWSSVINNWYRIKAMNDSRINKKVNTWAVSVSGKRCRNVLSNKETVRDNRHSLFVRNRRYNLCKQNFYKV